MSGPDTVVFDIGNVLIRWEPAAFYDARIGPDRRAQLFAEVALDAMNLEVDRGAPLRDSVMALARAHPAWADEIRHWHESWSQMLGPVITDSVALLRELRAARVPVFALTNFGAETFATACAAHPFLLEFDRAFVSAHLGLVKPDPAIYAHVERETGIAPARFFFVDDRADNIAAACARGWTGHVFTTPDALRADLARHGLRPAQGG